MKNLTQFLTKKMTLVALFGGLAMAAQAQEMEYYTWVDENGVTNYAERNPEGINATYVGRERAFGRPGQAFSDNTASASAAPGLPSGELPNGDSAARGERNINPDQLIEEEAAALAADLAEKKRINCEAGKNNLAQLRAFARVRVSDELGENRILTDEEKEAKAEEARQVIRDNCSA